jgi:hypothetical protein
MSNAKTLEFLSKYRACLQKSKSSLNGDADKKTSEILDTIMDEIDLIQGAMQSHSSPPYSFIWMLAKYTIGIPKTLSQEVTLEYNATLGANKNFQNIHEDLLASNLKEVAIDVDKYYVLCNILSHAALALSYASCILLMPPAPLFPYMIALYLLSVIVYGLLIAHIELNLVSMRLCHLELAKEMPKNYADLNFFKNTGNEMPTVLEAINESFKQQAFDI